MGDLEDYRNKRDFSSTSEPVAEKESDVSSDDDNIFRYVVQEHHASRLHWDFRMEMDGVLKSWALPKGPPQKDGERRLAIEVEDHPLDYLFFEGTIPEGNYGAGEVSIWDAGLYILLQRQPLKIKFVLNGERLNGAFVLVKGKEKNNWLMIKYQ